MIVRQSQSDEQLSAVLIVNDPVAFGLQLQDAGADPEVVLETTYGCYWAVDVLQAHGARVHLAHPLGVRGFRYRRVKSNVRDAGDLADLLRMGRLPEAWIAPPATRELRELVRYRAAKLVAIRSGLEAPVHAVLAKTGVLIAVSDLFGAGGRTRLAKVPLAAAYAQRVLSLLELIDILDSHEARFAALIAIRLDADRGLSSNPAVTRYRADAGGGVRRRDRLDRKPHWLRSRGAHGTVAAVPAGDRLHPPQVRHQRIRDIRVAAV